MTLLSLVLGLAYGFFGIENGLISTIAQNTNIVLYVLMFSVGISIGMHEGILQKIKEYHIKIFIVPLGIIAGSLVGGLLCSAIANIPVNYSMAIASGMGWYSLAGATISKLVGAEMGSIAFMSNLMREVFSFGIIPFLAVYFNYYTCIAPAGATSEDTTLPVMLKYTNEETVVLSVLNGMICSFFVPILISIFLNL
ncbi:lysine exporter LysO family protein [Pseudoflavonifractor capillosus]|uniref:lysine exporter LysO family protein n=1 Tax=Pseudoflavonifractor capillosus TaxID=106588 RepID=UPI001FA7B66F|nr:lysine exporter LysO family protein [Pseudoflavonifractor capillosus]